ncbi:MAG: hypothetical protein LBE79_12400 [Tannerella sp.]|jgi:hypothetical protein|nr:hypothetical protein [Tannerella sp.]
MESIDYHKDKVKPGRETRLFNEWRMIDAEYALDEAYGHLHESGNTISAQRKTHGHPSFGGICNAVGGITYRITKRNPSGLPLAYEITFRIKSITGVKEPDRQGLQKPVFGDNHILRITIPNNYPSADGGYPDFKFVTDIWHPNIRFFGEFKGHVCLNFNSSGTSTSLAEFIGKVAAYLRYDEYHALDVEPFPEDPTVAKWVREQAEPQGWVNQLKIENESNKLQFRQDEG